MLSAQYVGQLLAVQLSCDLNLDPPFSASLFLLAQWTDSVDFLVDLLFLKDSPEGTGLEQFYLFIFMTLLGSWTL